jgi:hypothetical protein
VEVSIPKVGGTLGPTLGDALGSKLGEEMVLGEAVGIGLRFGPLSEPSVGELVVETLDGPPVGALVVWSRTRPVFSLLPVISIWTLARLLVGTLVGSVICSRTSGLFPLSSIAIYWPVPLGKLVGLNDGNCSLTTPIHCPLSSRLVGLLNDGTLDGAVVVWSTPNGMLTSPSLIWSLVRTIVGNAVGLVDGTLDLDGRAVGALIVFSRILAFI